MPTREESTNDPGDRIALSIPSHPRYLGLLRTVVGTAADLLGFSREETHGMMLAVNEACANIIQHCYRMDDSQKIDITISILEDRLEIDLRDYGGAPAAEKAEQPCAQELEPGGLGLKLIAQTMDDVVYRPAGREGTLLTMVRYRRARDG